MYVILAYDVAVESINGVRVFLKRYLNWVQNSVFEGEVTEFELMAIEGGLRRMINPSSDSILIYCFPNRKYMGMREIGTRKSETGTIL